MQQVQPGEGPQEVPAGTLGELLFAKGSKPSVSEREWSALVGAIAEGDQRALHMLFSRMHRIVFTFLVRMTHNRETAEELTVDVFHEVWRRAPEFDPVGGSVVGWIMNLARSRALDRLRFEQRKKRVADPTHAPNEPVAEPGPHEAIAAKEQSRLVRQALDHLAPGEKQAIETAFFSELTYSEVATRLGQPVGTVKTRIRSGLAKLRRALVETEQPR